MHPTSRWCPGAWPWALLPNDLTSRCLSQLGLAPCRHAACPQLSPLCSVAGWEGATWCCCLQAGLCLQLGRGCRSIRGLPLPPVAWISSEAAASPWTHSPTFPGLAPSCCPGVKVSCGIHPHPGGPAWQCLSLKFPRVCTCTVCQCQGWYHGGWGGSGAGGQGPQAVGGRQGQVLRVNRRFWRIVWVPSPARGISRCVPPLGPSC